MDFGYCVRCVVKWSNRFWVHSLRLFPHLVSTSTTFCEPRQWSRTMITRWKVKPVVVFTKHAFPALVSASCRSQYHPRIKVGGLSQQAKACWAMRYAISSPSRFPRTKLPLWKSAWRTTIGTGKMGDEWDLGCWGSSPHLHPYGNGERTNQELRNALAETHVHVLPNGTIVFYIVNLLGEIWLSIPARLNSMCSHRGSRRTFCKMWLKITELNV